MFRAPGPGDARRPSPMGEANLISKLTWYWMQPIISKGYKTPIQDEDLPELLTADKAAVITQRLTKEWSAERAKEMPSLKKAILRTFKWQIFWASVAGVGESISRVLEAVFLSLIISFYDDGDSPVGQGILYSLLLFLTIAAHAALHHVFFFITYRLGVQIRAATTCLIYAKTLRLQSSSLITLTSGHVINMVSNDMQKFDEAAIFSHFLWLGPLEAIVCFVLMFRLIGWAAAVGYALLLLLVPLQAFISSRTGTIRSATAQLSDSRIKVVSDLLNGIRILKMYAWEKFFARIVAERRAAEVDSIRRVTRFRALNMALFFSYQYFIAFATFTVVWIIDPSGLTAPVVFTSMTLYNLARLMITLFAPKALEALSESMVSIRRIQNYLSLPEVGERVVADDDAPVGAVRIGGGHFTWVDPEVDSEAAKEAAEGKKANGKGKTSAAGDAPASRTKVTDFELAGINLDFEPGSLTAIVGSVGAGKSSLLHAILGEMHRVEGSLKRRGRMALVEHQPWIMAATIRENITFGRPFDENRYQRVIEDCALTLDLEQFEDGDRTEIGEKGINLSGGQKVRVALARACYADADIVLLDDPLSAVDAHVSKHLFNHCIRGFLRGKTCVLVTHQLQYAFKCDSVVLLENGVVVEAGLSSDLRAKSDKIAALVDKYGGGKKNPWEKSREETTAQESRAVEYLAGDKAADGAKAIIVAEDRDEGVVTLKVYKEYARAGGGVLLFVGLALLGIVTQAVAVGTNFWLSYWTGQGDEQKSDGFNVGMYAILVTICVILATVRAFAYFLVLLRSSRNLHDSMFTAVMHSPVGFFDANPIGRILNRFSKDQGLVDENLPLVAFDFVQATLIAVGAITVACIANPWVIIAIVPVGIIFVLIRRYFVRTSREVKRLDAITRSPIFADFSATLQGLTIIRTFGVETEAEVNFLRTYDANTRAFFIFMGASRWLGFRLDMLSAFFAAVVLFASLPLRHTLSPGLLGFALMSSLQLTGLLQWAVRQSVETENFMTSVERMVRYAELAPESTSTDLPPEGWPSRGEVALSGLNLRYRPDLPNVLSGITVTFEAGHKVGVVGRTGAGKSSLAQALLRMVEPYPGGCVRIDGIDTSQLLVQSLRSKISVIPQDPVLFSGTIRSNLDPFDEYSERDLWRALEATELSKLVNAHPALLEREVAESGSNLSTGEKQLMCLARALLRRNKILIMDEATANVDMETDALIQRTLRENFEDALVLTVAHRINTVIEYDRILVLDAGRVMEYDTPRNLILRGGFFAALVRSSSGKRDLYRAVGLDYDAEEGIVDSPVDGASAPRKDKKKKRKKERAAPRHSSPLPEANLADPAPLPELVPVSSASISSSLISSTWEKTVSFSDSSEPW